MSIQTVGVVGAGVMGRGVAQALSQAGFNTILVDVSDEILDQARFEIKQNIRLQRMMNKTAQGESADVLLQRIECSNQYQKLERVDFLIENVTENFEIKREVYRQL